jgi:predicted RNase H-like nuclease (RuvC/YqgF family)
MQNVGPTILATVLSVIVTLVVTLIFNKLIALPAAVKKQREEELKAVATKEKAEKEYKAEIDARLKRVEAAVDALPGYRQQSFQIQAKLEAEQSEVVQLCKSLKETITAMDERLKATQAQTNERAMNDLRQKLISEYRLFTNPNKNPMRAWSEMERKAFMSQVKDYEKLGGNDYIHKTVLPAMNDLEEISMCDTERLAELMSSRVL